MKPLPVPKKEHVVDYEALELSGLPLTYPLFIEPDKALEKVLGNEVKREERGKRFLVPLFSFMKRR